MRDMIEKLNKELKGVKITKELVSRIEAFRMEYLINNAEFFSKPLTGTVRLYFRTADVSHFFTDVINVSERDVMESRKNVKGINLDHKISTDHFNLTLMQLCHLVASSRLDAKTKDTGTKALLYIFVYRTLAALVSDRFTNYLADVSDAYATYESMSDKFILKKVKSWAKYAQYRVEAMLDPKGIHYDRILHLPTDKVLLNSIVLLQTSVASTFNSIYATHLRTLEKGDSTLKKSVIEESFGEEVVASVTTGVLSKIESTLDDMAYKGFIDKDLIRVCTSSISVVKDTNLESLIRLFQDEVDGKYHKRFDAYLKDSLVWVYAYLLREKVNVGEIHITKLIPLVEGALSSSRTKDESLLKLRKEGTVLISKMKGFKARTLINPYRNAVTLYLFLHSRLKT